jgi:hypothetical protein
LKNLFKPERKEAQVWEQKAQGGVVLRKKKKKLWIIMIDVRMSGLGSE